MEDTTARWRSVMVVLGQSGTERRPGPAHITRLTLHQLSSTPGILIWSVLQLTWVSVTTSTMVRYLGPTDVARVVLLLKDGTSICAIATRNRPHEGGLRARRPVVGPVLTGQHRRARLAFATEHQNWQIRHRRLVLFTDESRFYLSTCDRRDRLWRRRGECYAVCSIIQHDRFGGGPYAGAVGPGFLLVHNNARPHVARVCRQFLENEGTDTIDWPTGSPDLNPIEHLWDIMFRSIRRHQAALQTVQELSDALVQIWEEIPQDTIRRLIRSGVTPGQSDPWSECILVRVIPGQKDPWSECILVRVYPGQSDP
ncbi:hypothetical protein NFI96_010008 [Prochilodus magdalenae]|nr:hypothetical protein NFI96_010008 [Prochilodus magdalenae]